MSHHLPPISQSDLLRAALTRVGQENAELKERNAQLTELWTRLQGVIEREGGPAEMVRLNIAMEENTSEDGKLDIKGAQLCYLKSLWDELAELKKWAA